MALAGLLVCGDCGGPVTVVRSRIEHGQRVRGIGCHRRHYFTNGCTKVGLLCLETLEQTVTEHLRGYFSDVKLMRQHLQRFYKALGHARREQSVLETRAQAELAAADAEQKRRDAQKAVEVAQQAKTSTPVLLPPAEVLRGLNAQHLRERSETFRRLLVKIQLRSELPRDQRKVSRWIVDLTYRPDAGVKGLPERITVGCPGQA